VEHQVAGLLAALEASAIGLTVRDAVMLYPLANVLHVVALMVFFAAVAVMDFRVLGLLGEGSVAATLGRFRKIAIAAFLVVAGTGGVMFVAEATGIALNPSFQVKLVLIAIGLLNVVWLEASLRRRPASVAVPISARAAASLSLVVWLSVAAAGRWIAYV
jgi:hypothetical protein